MPPPKTTTKKHDNRRLNNPFPRAGGGGGGALRLPHAAFLSFASPKLAHAQAFPVGGHFHLRWDPALGGSLSLSLLSASPSRAPLWRTIPGEAFLSAASVATEAHECRGSFALRDARVRLAADRQLVERIRTFYRCDVDANTDGVDLLRATSFQQSNETRFPVVVITGLLRAKKKDGKPPCCGLRSAKARAAERSVLSARYWILLEQKSDTQVGFSVRIGDYTWNSNHDHAKPAKPAPRIHRSARWRMALRTTKKKPSVFPTGEEMASLLPQQEAECFEEFNRVFITYESDPDERFYGFGEQFSHMEFKGRRVPVLVQEQGIGRGDQPITFAANLVSYRSGGNWSTTYAPSPYYMTSKMRSLYLEGYDYSMFDLTKRDRVQIQVYGSSVQGRILYGESPTEVIASLTESIGRPPVLPSWIISGAVVGMQGGTDAICRVWNQLQHHDVPVSAFWLQDWVGPRKTAIGSQLWWNWEVDTDHYTGWSDLLRDLRRRNVRTMTYCNPCLVPVDQKPNSRRHLFEEAKKLGILVKDQSGEPYMMPNTAFDVAMLDFTNPEANVWFKKILQEMVDDGVRGWMADFGEGLPLDAQLHSGEDPIAAHNRYPELWAQVNWEFVDEWKSQANEADAEAEDDDGLVFFVRSGFRESARWAMLFWEGDQMVSWQTNDGIKSSVVGLLSGGLSGFPLNHSDVGGYCTVDVPFLRYRRSEELLMRWMEVNAFTVVFRTHEGNKPESNCQFYSNSSTLAHFARCAKMYKAWEFYRIQLVKEASDRGLPVARHLFLHYPEDKHIQRMTYQQFLVGTEILVVPVLDKGKKAVNAYFPVSDGSSWKHIWTGDVYDSPWSRRISGETLQGFEAEVEAPMGYPAVFVKVASPVGEKFVNNLRDLNVL